jgi:hypothetical protein
MNITSLGIFLLGAFELPVTNIADTGALGTCVALTRWDGKKRDARFEILRVVTVFWDVTSFSPPEFQLYFGGTYYRELQTRNVSQRSNQQDRNLYPVNGCTTFFRNIGEVLRDFMASHPRGHHSSRLMRLRSTIVISKNFWGKIQHHIRLNASVCMMRLARTTN